MYNYIMKGLLIGESVNNIINRIDFKHLITYIKCASKTDKTIGNFDNRYNNGSDWEKLTVYRLQDKNKDMQFELTKGKNTNADIITSKGELKRFIEVKSEIAPNIYNSFCIKAAQFNYINNSWEKSSLLSGFNSDIWLHYFLYKNKWHYFSMTKGELKQLCSLYGKSIIINENVAYKAKQKVYILPMDKVTYKPLCYSC